jgi:hypothetical protein
VDGEEDGTFGDDELYEEEEPRETRTEAVVGPGRLKERIRLCRQELEEALGPAKFAEAYRIARKRGWDSDYPLEVGGEAVDDLSDVLTVSPSRVCGCHWVHPLPLRWLGVHPVRTHAPPPVPRPPTCD